MSYKISWEHGEYNPVVKREKSPQTRNLTTCIIEQEGKEVAKATIGCYYKDVNNRKVARRESFKKAVEQIGNKQERTNLWKQFKERHIKCLSC